ncbi:MAG: tetratricopeptide repeat protein [Chloroflexota bacterium]|nr:tetratricopeptide repeat protein [Chloroflexota bacterium]
MSLKRRSVRILRNAADPGAVEGDLRPVTVLFADICGFTRLAELLPPENLVAAINGCFEVLDEGIAHYGGEIDKFLGDAVMATFGESVAHDDDPRRAVLAALEMQSALSLLNSRLHKEIGCELEMRIGVNTGVVLAGPIGSRRKRSFTVVGDAVNIAARLEHAAPVGGILIGEATRAYLGNSFRLRLRRSVRIRGKDAPVRSFVVLGQTTATRGTTAGDRFLGRTVDLEQALAALAPLRAGRRAMVEIDGGVGIGKSALAAAIRRAAGRGRGWLNVDCPPYGQDLPYTTLAGLLRGLIQRMDGAHALESTLAASPDAEGLDVNLAAAVVRDLLAQSSDAADSRTASLTAQLRKGLLARTTKTLLRDAAARQPLVVALDDCHWLDAASAAIVAEAIGDLHDSALGWLIMHRPGWSLPTGLAADAHIHLEALDPKTSAALAKSLLGRAASDQTIAFVVDRAEGNPLYLVELCGAVFEGGTRPRSRGAAEAQAQPTHLTDQLRSLILSRIDSLDEGARRATHVAAVLGHAFPATLLRRVLGRGDWGAVLARLEEHAILRRQSRVRGDGRGTTWTWHFRHTLVQETVYASLLSATRTSLHRVAGDALEGMSDDAVADRLALLALHFGRGDDAARAVHYLCAAGDRARLLYLNREAIHYYEDALGRLGSAVVNRPRRAEVLASLGSALEVLSEDAAAMDNLRAALDLEQRLDVRADLWRQLAEIHRRRGSYAAAEDGLSRAEACLEGEGSSVELARVRIARAMLAIERGADAEARALGDQAVDLLVGQASVDLDRAAAYRAVGIGAAREEDFPKAREAFEKALECADSTANALLSATISLNLGTVLHLQGEVDEALKLYHRALEFHERIGAKRGVALASNNLGDLYWRGGAGDWSQALTHWQRALRIYDAIGDQRGLATTLRNLGQAHVQRGAFDAAEPLLRRARGLGRELDQQATQW